MNLEEADFLSTSKISAKMIQLFNFNFLQMVPDHQREVTNSWNICAFEVITKTTGKPHDKKSYIISQVKKEMRFLIVFGRVQNHKISVDELDDSVNEKEADLLLQGTFKWIPSIPIVTAYI